MKQVFRNNLLIGLTALLVLASICGPCVVFCRMSDPETATEAQDYASRDFEKRLEAYLEWKSEGFLDWLVAKEKQLVQMIQLVSNEVKARAQAGQDVGQFGFSEIYGRSDEIFESYSSEIDQLMALYDQLDSLEAVASGSEVSLWEEVAKTKDGLVDAVEDRELYAARQYTKRDLVEMVAEYSLELDTLISIYENLERLQKHQDGESDAGTQAEISRQKQQMLDILSRWGGPPYLADKVVGDYIDEADSLVALLSELNKLDADGAGADPDTRSALRGIRGDILDSVDERLLRLAGYNGLTPDSGPTVSEFLEEWERERTANLEARFAEYLVAKKGLIIMATEKQRDRMLGRELSDALLNYAGDDFLLAEMQLSAILRDYSDYYKGIDPVIFYRNECFFAQDFFDAAADGYRDLVEHHSGSEYLTEAILRLMQISRIYGRQDEFYYYYDQMRSFAERAHPQELHQAHLLGGHSLLQDRRPQDAYEALTQIPSSSPYFGEAQMLVGVSYLMRDDYDGATAVFENLAGLESFPWTGMDAAHLRNTALLKLELIAYQRGELGTATEYFDRVSTGYEERDRGVVAAAWTMLKKGNYQASLDLANLLLREYPGSSYTYEALVLAAHCKRILGKTDKALTDHRLVAEAQGVVDVDEDYSTERRRLYDQAGALSRLEEVALERSDAFIFPELEALRKSINRSLADIRYRSDSGELIVQNLESETAGLLDQVAALENVIEEARQAGREDAAAKAQELRLRLLRILADLESKRMMLNSSYLVDHPVVARELESQYHKTSFESAVRQLETEKSRIETDLTAIQELQGNSSGADFNARFGLELLERRLRSLRNGLSKFRVWVARSPAEEVYTDLEQWADRSGVEMTDIAYTTLEDEQKDIEQTAERVVAVDQLLAERKAEIEKRLQEFDQQLRRLQADIEAQQVRLEMEERRRYFESSYFDTSESEVESQPTTEVPQNPDGSEDLH